MIMFYILGNMLEGVFFNILGLCWIRRKKDVKVVICVWYDGLF